MEIELTKNTILQTKDGRVIGNAIIINISPCGIFTIKTDYGNTSTFTKQELLNIFYVRKYADFYEKEYVESTHKNYAK